MAVDTWLPAVQDSLADVEIVLDDELRARELNTMLRAFVGAEGQAYITPYDAIRERVDRNVSNHRIETLKKLFEMAGLISVTTDRTIRPTPFARAVVDTWANVDMLLQAARDNIARTAVTVLGRYQLRNPTTMERGYPADTDVFPYRVIWSAMLALDGKLHHEELNRVLMRVMRQVQLGEAIERIRVARTSTNYDPNDADSAQAYLGPRSRESGAETTRRMTPWFSITGFGGLLIDREAQAGYRSIRPEYLDLITDEVGRSVIYRDFGTDREAWFEYLSRPAGALPPAPNTAEEAELRNRALELCRRFGSTRFILFSGPAGTGKTRMAGIVAQLLTEGDESRVFEAQFHESYSYDDFVEGLKPNPEGGFDEMPRILRCANERAKEVETVDPDGKVVLIIEEFSRANLSNVLGELFTYIEHRGREFQLSLSGVREYISPNLVIIGTMNPLDRSVVEMDEALIRRTRRLEFPYSEQALRSILEGNGLPGEVIDALAVAITPLSEHLPFGHGVFVDVRTEEDLHYLWSEQLRLYFIKPSGQRHPKYKEFVEAYKWIDPDYTATSRGS